MCELATHPMPRLLPELVAARYYTERMSIEATLAITSANSSATEQLAEKIGHNLRGGETIELVSDLGGGKTTFVRGLARGMGSTDNVASPTFTLSRQYRAGSLNLHHYDFYRLAEPGVVAHELAEVVGQSDSVIVVEWADIVRGVLPTKRLRITFKTLGEHERHLEINCPEELRYLTAGIA